MDIEKQVDYWKESAEHDLEIIKVLEKLIKALKEHKIPVSEAYLFGSYANGNNAQYSDINVALVSDEFSGVRYYDVKKIGRIVRNIDFRIEIHPFALKDKDESMFLDEIIRTGIRVA